MKFTKSRTELFKDKTPTGSTSKYSRIKPNSKSLIVVEAWENPIFCV